MIVNWMHVDESIYGNKVICDYILRNDSLEILS